jgi:hypothetical protein
LKKKLLVLSMWKLTLGMVIGNTWFHPNHLEKLTELFCHIFSSRAIFPCVLSIGDKHKGNFLKSSLSWGRKWSHMLGLTNSHKFLAFARIGIWGLTLTSLLWQWLKLVKPLRGCLSYATHKKITNLKNGQWQRQHIDSFLISVPHDSR